MHDEYAALGVEGLRRDCVAAVSPSARIVCVLARGKRRGEHVEAGRFGYRVQHEHELVERASNGPCINLIAVVASTYR